MKIVNPSTEIIEDQLSQLSLYQRIAYVAGVCYQREPRKTEDEAQAFCRRMVDIGHHSTLEMAAVHLVVRNTMFPNSKFITVTPQDDWGRYVVSGSIRAILEANGEYGSRIWNFLAWKLPVLFSESDHPCGNVRFAEPNEIPWQHKHVAVRFIVNRAVSHELVRHRVSSYLQECLSGDTVVKAYSGKRQWTMEELYRLFTTKNCGIARKKIRIRTMSREGEIVPSKIINVVKSGKKEVFILKTKNGKSIKASENHIFFAEDGQRRVKELSVGNRLFVNGVTLSKEWLREEYLVKNRERVDIASEVGMSDSWLGKQLAKWGLQKDKSSYPNRKPGYGKPGMHSTEGKQSISKAKKGEKNPAWVGDDITDRGARSRLHRNDTACGRTCECGNRAVEIHHMDRNPKNNNQENLEYLCVPCHKARHSDTVRITWLDEIVSIEPCGHEMTYDLEVDHPDHNFSANGFIVHNSQRYCRYEDEVVFIRPEWWDDDQYWNGRTIEHVWRDRMASAEQGYKVLMANGLKPQQARAVLPNSTKTELIAYASLPQWKHMFNLRCSPAADPEMSRVMIPLREQFQQQYPEAFAVESDL